MPIDLREFHRTFFDESLEAIDVMERGLLDLERSVSRGEMPGDSYEEINRIFRSAHSIKGAGGTFGFGAIAEFAHLLESILEELRARRRAPEADLIGLLLRASDGLRELVKAARAGQSTDPPQIHGLRTELAAALDGEPTRVAPHFVDAADTAGGTGWQIQFRPHPSLFATGNDPLRILRELAALGPATLVVDRSALPAWEAFDPQCCYLAWSIRLAAPVPRAVLDEIFAWVSDACDLSITPLEPPAAPSPSSDDVVGTIRVATDKVDALVDMVGELLITQTMLQQLVADVPPERLLRARATLAQLARHTRQLQDLVLGIRMLPIGFVYGRLPRLVRDVSRQLGKKVMLQLSGESTELDKTIIERIADPLIHILRNAIDHGIEAPAERRQSGKPENGTIRIEAYHRGGSVVIEIADDGRGLDRERILASARARGLVAPGHTPGAREIEELIFVPGFSTAETVNDVSGRGVGLDVVRNNIRSLGGGVEVLSEPDQGTRFRIRLPLTLAIVDGLALRLGTQTYIVPLGWVSESLRLQAADIVRPAGGAELYGRRNAYFPLLRLAELFGVEPQGNDPVVVIVEADGQRAGLVVDELLGQQQAVIKSLDTHCYKLAGIAAATVLGDGRVALILDAAALVRQAHRAAPVLTDSGDAARAAAPLH